MPPGVPNWLPGNILIGVVAVLKHCKDRLCARLLCAVEELNSVLLKGSFATPQIGAAALACAQFAVA